MKRLSRHVVLILVIPAFVFAGDEATLDFLGFSEDGAYLMFEQFGWFDGSGFPYSEIIFVDVVHNSFAGAPISVVLDDEEEWEQSASESAFEQAQGRVIDLGIVMGNKGFHVISQPRGEPQYDPHHVSFDDTDLPLDSLGKYFQCTLTLTEIDSGDTANINEMFGPSKMMELTIMIPGENEPHVLQRDSRLPKRRGYVLSYHISDVYMYCHNAAPHVAVFISYVTPGFEGPDIRYMVVTGQLPF